MLSVSNLDVITSETGATLTITDEMFNSWWEATVLPEDAAEFVHFHQGTIDGARLVCAIQYLTAVQGGKYSSDLLVQAYCLAMNIPHQAGVTTRQNAQLLYQSDQVEFLLERVRLRDRRLAEERIAMRTAKKIEELYERSAGLDGKEQLDTERAALEASVRYMANQSKERAQEAERRNKRAMQEAVKRSKELDMDRRRVPSLQEVKHVLAMLVEAHGAESVSDLLRDVTPKGLRDADIRP